MAIGIILAIVFVVLTIVASVIAYNCFDNDHTAAGVFVVVCAITLAFSFVSGTN